MQNSFGHCSPAITWVTGLGGVSASPGTAADLLVARSCGAQEQAERNWLAEWQAAERAEGMPKLSLQRAPSKQQVDMLRQVIALIEEEKDDQLLETLRNKEFRDSTGTLDNPAELGVFANHLETSAWKEAYVSASTA